MYYIALKSIENIIRIFFDEKLKVAEDASETTVLAVSFSRSEKPLRQINSRDCISRAIQQRCSRVVLLVIGRFSILTIVRRSLAGHRVGRWDYTERWERKRGDIYTSFLLRFSPREQNGNNMSPGRESNLVAGRRKKGGGGGCTKFL